MVKATNSKKQQMKNKNQNKKRITEGMFFEIRITSRYINLMGMQAFNKMKIDISFEEYLILDVVSYNEGICQIDLAKKLLRDRSNIGKIVSALEKKGLLKINPDTRNKRLIKKLYISEKGLKKCNDINMKLNPYIKILNETIKEDEQKIIVKSMMKCREIIENIVETKI